MKVVLDTSALIYLNDFRQFEEMYTVQDVVNEVKDKITSLKLSGIKLKIVEPSEQSVEEIEKIAKSTGDLERLSGTDVKILAIAKEIDYTIVSDDRNIQNVAEKVGIKYLSVFSKKITKLITWKKYCENCKKYFDSGQLCKNCGARLKRVPVSSRDINRNI